MSTVTMKSTPLKSKQEIDGKIELVTPTIARGMLATNFRNNRNLNRVSLAKMTKDMRDGAWKENLLDPIRFNKKGELIDGQHRLTALVQANVALRMLVVRNIDEDDVHAIDTGRNRTPGDMLKIAGYKQAPLMASALRAMACIKRGPLTPKSMVDVTHDELRQLAARHESLQDSCALNKAPRGVRPTLVVVFHYIGMHLLNYKAEADGWMSVWNTGIPAYEGDVAHHYRERLMRATVTGGVGERLGAAEGLMQMGHVWNLFVERKGVTKLNFPQSVTIKGLDPDSI